MRIFAAVVEQRSLSAAAVALRTWLPTVSRTLGMLERELGVKLISPTTRGLAETDGGRLYYRRCQRIPGEIREAHRYLFIRMIWRDTIACISRITCAPTSGAF